MYVPELVSELSVSEPLVAWAPIHEPLAMHDAASVVDHVNVDAALYATVVGLALNAMVGGRGIVGAVTVTCADWVAVPPGPVQVKENVVVVSNICDC